HLDVVMHIAENRIVHTFELILCDVHCMLEMCLCSVARKVVMGMLFHRIVVMDCDNNTVAFQKIYTVNPLSVLSHNPFLSMLVVYRVKPMISKQYSKESDVKDGNIFDDKEALDLAIRLRALNSGF
nr:hypothetical protein [Tanacetum cinerariifolium]